MLVWIKELKEEIKEKPNWNFVAERIKNWSFHCESFNQTGKYNDLIFKIQRLYNTTKDNINWKNKKKKVLEYVDLIIIELTKLTEKKKELEKE